MGDGRFHLESIMIHNPLVAAFQYNPYSRQLTSEKYDHNQMIEARKKSICQARNSKNFGLLLGTLGRQGNIKVFEVFFLNLKYNNKYFRMQKEEL